MKIVNKFTKIKIIYDDSNIKRLKIFSKSDEY